MNGSVTAIEKKKTVGLSASTRRAVSHLLRFSIIAVVFSFSYTQLPLYSENQNTYFLHGLADAGRGFLSESPQARTVDPFPVFSLLVNVTYRFLGEPVFYVYYVLILGVYICSLLGIADQRYSLARSRIWYLVYLLLLIGIHSRALRPSLQPLYEGMAGQYVLGSVFQPSVFGVFLITSISLFLRGRPFLAVGSLGLAAIFHASYLLSAAALTGAYLFLILREEQNCRKAFGVGLFALALVLPVVGYSYIVLAPSSPETWHEAQNILVNIRFPHHSVPARWFDTTALVQVSIIVLALYIVRRTRLFVLLAVPFVVGFVLTLLQLASGSNTLALLFPWRVSAFLVPLSTTVLIARLISSLPYREYKRQTFITLLIFLIIFGFVISGVIYMVGDFVRRRQTPLVNFVQQTALPGDLFLIPVEWEDFQLDTGVPVFVDWKTHPYKDSEVVNWYSRVQIARSVYEAYREGVLSCEYLTTLAVNHGITHVVFSGADSEVTCRRLLEVYADSQHRVYRIR